MIDWTKPVRQKGFPDRKVRVLCSDRKKKLYPIVALIEQPSGEEALEAYQLDGSLFQSPEDFWLENIPEKKKFYINIYEDCCKGYTSRSSADCHAMKVTRLRCVEVEL